MEAGCGALGDGWQGVSRITTEERAENKGEDVGGVTDFVVRIWANKEEPACDKIPKGFCAGPNRHYPADDTGQVVHPLLTDDELNWN